MHATRFLQPTFWSAVRINTELACRPATCNRIESLHRPHSAWRADSPSQRPPPHPATLAVLRRASGREPVLFSRDAGGWLGRRPGGVRADRRGSSAARHQAVGLELVGSLPVHSAALLSGGRRRLTTACVCSRGLAPPRAAPRLHSAWPRLLACARLGHAPSHAAGSPARRPPAALAPRAVRASAARLLGRRGRAIQRRTRWSEGDSARLTPRLASPCGSLVLASPPGTRAARAAATAAQQELSDGRVVSHRQRFTCC